jgi:transposase
MISDESGLLISAQSCCPSADCPACHQASSRIHSFYHRSPQDLPISGQRVRLKLRVRRFRCLNPQCPKTTFAERLPKVVPFASRQTTRLSTLVKVFALLVGGELGSRLLAHMGTQLSADALLRRVNGSHPVSFPTPSILGVDDFALRRGRRYGTLLIDWERRQPIDLLADRTAETFAGWLRAHPGIEWISRDRSGEYARGASEGAPSARQVVDRWHLIKNWREMLERALHRLYARLKARSTHEASTPYPRLPREQSANERQARSVSRARRIARYEQVNELFRKGLPILQIARQLHLTRTTVYKYIAAGAFPERAPRSPSGTTRSILDPYVSYLKQRAEQGCANGRQLYREVREQGYSGSYKTVVRWLQAQGLLPRHSLEQEWAEKSEQNTWGGDLAIPSELRFSPASSDTMKQVTLSDPLPSAQALSWLLVKDPTSLKAEEQQVLAFIEQEPAIETMYLLTKQFSRLLKERQADHLEAWLKICAEAGIPEVAAFAQGVWRDFDAVKAAFQFPYSNGPTEGLINRLKLLKRSMYGRGSFEMLRHRMLSEVSCYC